MADMFSGSSKLELNLNDMSSKVTIATLMIAATEASRLQGYMQANRPWTDQTGKAKATLNAKASAISDSVVRITLAHGVDYGIWLELANEKNYAILEPTLRLEGPKVLEAFKNFYEKIV